MALAKKLKLDNTGGIDIPVGQTIGLLLNIVHVGTQKNTYKGVTTLKDQVVFTFELQDELMDNSQPIKTSKVETNSMKSKANLVKLGKAMGANVTEGIDFEALVGKGVMLNMDHNEAKTRVVVKGYGVIPKKLIGEVKPLMGTPKVLLDVDEITDSQLKDLPEWIQKMINERVRDSSNDSDSDGIEL